MKLGILIIALIFAVIEWFAESREKLRLIYLTKPLTMVLLLVWLFIISLHGNALGTNLIWFLIGMGL